jgi:hypothetical protein
MGVNYINYNELGLLDGSPTLSPVSKGNNYVDTFYFHFENRDFTQAYLTFTATLPNGNTLPSATATPTKYKEGVVDKNGYMMKLSNAYTSIAGTLTFTLALKQNSNNQTLCSAQLSIPINDNDVPAPTTITETEKDQINQAIADAVRDLDARKVEVDLSIYGEATEIVENNGKIALSHLGKTYNLPATKVINKVYSVNGEIGDVELTSNEIPHGNSNVNIELEKKPNRDEVCYYRDGEVIPTELKAKGFLSYTAGQSTNGKGYEIVLDSENFENGDLVSFDVDFLIGGGYQTTASYIKLLHGDFSDKRYMDINGNISEVLIEGSYRENKLTIHWHSTRDTASIELKNVSVFRW